jgi:hypothetical protein
MYVFNLCIGFHRVALALVLQHFVNQSYAHAWLSERDLLN